MPESEPEGTDGFISRRGFVAAAAVAVPLVSGCARLLSLVPPAIGHHPHPAALTPYITPNEDFFLVAVDPRYRPPVGPNTVGSGWALELVGLNGVSRRISYAELSSRARSTVHYTFECIGNPVGGQLIGNAEWRVLPLRDLVRDAPGGPAGARSVMFEGTDGFYSSVSLERATDDYALLALEMNGAVLSQEHGFPARVILPDLYGKKQPRWLSRIALLEDERTTSYWERRLWKGGHPVKTTSRFDPRETLAAGRPAELTGMAVAGARGVRAVEVSLDGGRNWVPCDLVTGQRPHTWSLWRYTWRRPTPGRHHLLVRAVDGTGALQTATRRGRFPSGASGHHRMTVSVS
ncbi:MAG TPA: molybdopterin-dependent oxidoreductase [Longimicrobium sp.]